MNSENSKTPKPHILILKLINKLDLKIGKEDIALSNLSIGKHMEKYKNLIH